MGDASASLPAGTTNPSMPGFAPFRLDGRGERGTQQTPSLRGLQIPGCPASPRSDWTGDAWDAFPTGTTNPSMPRFALFPFAGEGGNGGRIGHRPCEDYKSQHAPLFPVPIGRQGGNASDSLLARTTNPSMPRFALIPFAAVEGRWETQQTPSPRGLLNPSMPRFALFPFAGDGGGERSRLPPRGDYKSQHAPLCPVPIGRQSGNGGDASDSLLARTTNPSVPRFDLIPFAAGGEEMQQTPSPRGPQIPACPTPPLSDWTGDASDSLPTGTTSPSMPRSSPFRLYGRRVGLPPRGDYRSQHAPLCPVPIGREGGNASASLPAGTTNPSMPRCAPFRLDGRVGTYRPPSPRGLQVPACPVPTGRETRGPPSPRGLQIPACNTPPRSDWTGGWERTDLPPRGDYNSQHAPLPPVPIGREGGNASASLPAGTPSPSMPRRSPFRSERACARAARRGP
ncbi:collagen alpha-1(I) chain-like [Tachyglossus aculeatus]|uniref:collagen alpha-1(I) chain-like n=1 Tax=Tachyglossus aculeatus TaxID=9261 RepID=UPI0018F60186|nr:collagen alpha-1(I) chain-like [Tachyglossus aculeatus]